MLKLKKGDIVEVAKGDDRGKKGRVLKTFANENKVIVEGINLVKKHKRRTQEDQQGGVVSLEAAMSIFNLRVICKNCNKPTRIGFSRLKDASKTRICKFCKEPI